MTKKDKKIWSKEKFSAERRAIVEDVYAKMKGSGNARSTTTSEGIDTTTESAVTLGDPSDYYDNPPYVLPDNSGLYHTDVATPRVHYKRAKGEKIIKRKNAYIVLGRDRPSSNRSGWGSKGAINAASIDLVVGRMAGARDGQGVDDGTHVDNSFSADAARIHISQMTDIDKNFGIATNEITAAPPRSGIGIKADLVRVIGREGVKIVTGKCDGCKPAEKNSMGGKLLPAPRIILQAGNNVESRMVFGGLFNTPEKYNNLQGVARGENVVESLRDLAEILDEVMSALINFLLLQQAFNGAVGVDPIRPWVPTAAGSFVALSIPWIMDSIIQTRTNKTLWEINHLYPCGYRFIPSRNVYST